MIDRQFRRKVESRDRHPDLHSFWARLGAGWLVIHNYLVLIMYVKRRAGSDPDHNYDADFT